MSSVERVARINEALAQRPATIRMFGDPVTVSRVKFGKGGWSVYVIDGLPVSWYSAGPLTITDIMRAIAGVES